MDEINWLEIATKHTDLIGWLLFNILLTVGGGTGVYWMARFRQMYEDSEFFQYAVDHVWAGVKRQVRKSSGTKIKRSEKGLELLRKVYTDVGKRITPEIEMKFMSAVSSRHEVEKEMESRGLGTVPALPALPKNGGDSGN